jgi:hypothetical protein
MREAIRQSAETTLQRAERRLAQLRAPTDRSVQAAVDEHGTDGQPVVDWRTSPPGSGASRSIRLACCMIDAGRVRLASRRGVARRRTASILAPPGS